MNLKIDLTAVLANVIAQTIAFYNIKTTEEETNQLINNILESKSFIESYSNTITFENTKD